MKYTFKLFIFTLTFSLAVFVSCTGNDAFRTMKGDGQATGGRIETPTNPYKLIANLANAGLSCRLTALENASKVICFITVKGSTATEKESGVQFKVQLNIEGQTACTTESSGLSFLCSVPEYNQSTSIPVILSGTSETQLAPVVLGIVLAEAVIPLLATPPTTPVKTFVTVWKTDNIGISSNLQIKLPLESSGTYNFNVNWGDGSSAQIQSWNDTAITHTYAAVGTYTVSITGTIVGFRFNSAGDKLKLLQIKEWGPLRVGNSGAYFSGANNLVVTATDIPDFTGTTDFSHFFRECSSLTTVPNMNKWDVSHATTMYYMFFGALIFNENIGDWNVSSVTNMVSMFNMSYAFNQDIGIWNVSKVTNMQAMFAADVVFNQDISNWDVSNVTNIGEMFSSAYAFNQDLSKWNVSKVTDMHRTFQYCGFNYDINNWDVSNVADMFSMFEGSPYNHELSNWNVAKVTNMSLMFHASNFNSPIGNWNVSSVTNMSQMFQASPIFNQAIGNWNVAQVTNMNFMFENASSFNQNINNWNVGSVTQMVSMFNRATAFNQPMNNWNMSYVVSTQHMFDHAASFNQPIGNWNVANVIDMKYMFSQASSFNQPIGNWNVSKVQSMESMFERAISFNQPIGNWNVAQVTTMQNMFNMASAFNQNLYNWTAGNVTTMSKMFNGATSFNQPPPNLVMKVTDMSNMFNGALAFNQSLANWNVVSVSDMTNLLNATSFSQANYDLLLVAWAALPQLKYDVPFHAGSAKYSTGPATIAHDSLTSGFGWFITDGG